MKLSCDMAKKRYFLLPKIQFSDMQPPEMYVLTSVILLQTIKHMMGMILRSESMIIPYPLSFKVCF